MKNREPVPVILTINQFAEKHKFMTVPALRWLIHKKKIEECLMRLGGRIYIHEEKFFKMLEKLSKARRISNGS